MDKNLAIYIHYPFCKSKCPYCDFNSHVNDNIDQQKFADCYITELEYFKELIGKRNITSIFFGGGTPSLMPINTVDKILKKISTLWNLSSDIEITLEANPTSSESQKFKDLKNIGINRLSIGIQALNDQDLKFLGRQHSKNEAYSTIDIAQKYFDNFSFDLIYARPNQTPESWKSELKTALKIGSPHLSLYQLTIEKGTKFFNSYRNKEFTLPNTDTQNKLYDITHDTCLEYGLENYEISNYCKNNYHSHHNLTYWNYRDYLGIGAGSHSRITLPIQTPPTKIDGLIESNKTKKSGGMSRLTENKYSIYQKMNYHMPQKWVTSIEKNKNAIQTSTPLTNEEIFTEIILIGLRTKFGVNLDRLFHYIENSAQNDNTNQLTKNKIKFLDKLDTLSKEKLIYQNNNHIYTTYKGSKLLNSVCSYLLAS